MLYIYMQFYVNFKKESLCIEQHVNLINILIILIIVIFSLMMTITQLYDSLQIRCLKVKVIEF